MTAITASYSHSSSAIFVAVHNGAFYSSRKGDNLKSGGMHFDLHAFVIFSFNENISVFF
jgi:hypothetical protein